MSMECLKCNRKILDDQFCECDSCKQKIHYTCAELTASEIKCVQLKNKRTLLFLCDNCQDGLRQIPALQKRMSSLEGKLDEVLKSITSLTNQNPINNQTYTTMSTAMNYEEVISEMEERKNKAKNVMIFNVMESTSSDIEEKQKHDKIIVEDLVKPILDKPQEYIKKVIRIGKLGDKPRPIKVILQDSDTALKILKNKNRVNLALIKISSDMTIHQRNYLKELRSELERRKNAGENTLTIKYVRGIPTIVNNISNRKNL